MSAQLDPSGSPFKAACHVHNASMTLTDESANARTATLTLKDAQNQAIGSRAIVDAYLSDDAEGDDQTGTTPTSVAAGAKGLVQALVAGKVFKLTTDASGQVEVVITYTGGAKTWYLNVQMPDGRLVTVGSIVFV